MASSKESTRQAGDAQVPSLGQEDPEKELVSISILAWKIPWEEKLYSTQSMMSKNWDMTLATKQ